VTHLLHNYDVFTKTIVAYRIEIDELTSWVKYWPPYKRRFMMKFGLPCRLYQSIFVESWRFFVGEISSSTTSSGFTEKNDTYYLRQISNRRHDRRILCENCCCCYNISPSSLVLICSYWLIFSAKYLLLQFASKSKNKCAHLQQSRGEICRLQCFELILNFKIVVCFCFFFKIIVVYI